MEEFIKQMEQFITPPPKIDEHGKQSSLEEESIRIIGTRPPISFHVLHTGQHIVITNTNGFSEKIPYHNRKNCRQNDSSYYQPQPTVQNHRQKYRNDRRIQKSYYKNDYDRDKGVAHGMICSVISTPENQATPIIPLEKDSYYRKKTNRCIFKFLKERNQRY